MNAKAQRAAELHDDAWRRYMSAWRKARVDKSFKAQQRLIERSAEVAERQCALWDLGI